MADVNAFSLRLHTIREVMCLEWRQLAYTCGVPITTLEGWVIKDRSPNLAQAYRVSKALGYRIEDMADPERELPEVPGPCVRPMTALAQQTKWGASLARAMKGRNVSAFIRDSGVNRTSLYVYMRGEGEPRLDRALELADLLGLSLHSMCAGE